MEKRNPAKISATVFDALKSLDPSQQAGTSRDYQSSQGIQSWVAEFARDLHIKYAIIIFDQGLLLSLRKVMEIGCGMDTGVIGGTSTAADVLQLSTSQLGNLIKASSAEGAVRRKSERERNLRANDQGQEVNASKGSKRTKEDSASSASDFNPERLMALEILVKNPNGAFNKRTEAALAKIAFGISTKDINEDEEASSEDEMIAMPDLSK